MVHEPYNSLMWSSFIIKVCYPMEKGRGIIAEMDIDFNQMGMDCLWGRGIVGKCESGKV